MTSFASLVPVAVPMDATAALWVGSIDAADSRRYAAFVDPLYHRHLGPGTSGLVHVAADQVTAAGDRRPRGLALAMLASDGFEIVSLGAQDDTDGRVRQALLQALARRCAAAGRPQGLYYATYDADDVLTPGLLQGCGWRGPAVERLVVRATTAAMLALPFLGAHGQPREGYAVVPWTVVDAAQRADLTADLAALPPLQRRNIDPAGYEARALPALSLALLRGGRVVAWHLPCRIGLDTLSWTCSAVRPGHEGAVAILLLWRLALQRQQALGIRRLAFTCDLFQDRFARFICRRLPPAIERLSLFARFDLPPVLTCQGNR
ncbi:hypothetical protein [Nitrospirillum sp. BR 11828]|uniref:hypothetical protein n=1 Tax=Nitrospirillum sp. BR 11828 TaxID=3104325 RepID=UPI002ACABBFE|nr:hypothetical protein [Nitrospirillum sp. BR 11828]MDZ5650736.1 hypothetical protein [Nitrospirillum sp. BR 11828]